jgi:hypothetical protein
MSGIEMIGNLGIALAHVNGVGAGTTGRDVGGRMTTTMTTIEETGIGGSTVGVRAEVENGKARTTKSK